MVQEIINTVTPDKTSAINIGEIPSDEKRKKVGNYIILKTIGEGSFAKVRLGIHIVTEMKVAVKVINKREVFKRNYLRANLRREAAMMQRMSHSNIVQLHEVMETENSYYIVLDLVQGTEFVKYLTKKKQLDEIETRKYIRQIVSAVDHMHRANVIHRDIKLQNFMLDQNNDIIIIDFGLSNSLDEKGFLTTQCGSPAYAAPEIFAHQEYGPAVDIWSIGVNMFAMLLGKLPFKVEQRSRNLAKLHACILKGCEIPTTLSKDCQDLLTRLLEPSPTKRISMQEILRHPFLVHHLGPIELIPYKPNSDMKEINKNIIRYLVFKHGYSEQETEEAVLHRRPTAARAFYTLIERRLQEGLGWPDQNYKTSVASTPSTVKGSSVVDGYSDVVVLDKLNRNEPLLPNRREIYRQPSVSNNNPNKISRDKPNYLFDENLIVRGSNNGTITSGLTQEAFNELVPHPRLAARKSIHDIILRNQSSIPGHGDNTEEYSNSRRTVYSNCLAPIKASISPQRENIIIAQQPQSTIKTRSLPNSTLDHANQNGFHLPHDPYNSRISKAPSRISHVEQPRKSQETSPVRYNPPSSVTVKAIGLFLKNSTINSRLGSCTSRTSKVTHGETLEIQQQSPTLKFYPNNNQTVINYRSQGHVTSKDPTRQTLVKTNGSSNKV
ncbi:unnamed protein product [Adineta steineri]|uniref:non-specific serine/threonine protein kinase n=2 Tax=Adineta steineri TaxID=433720 RepID=A0A819PNK4_9BILA|nr:unnamed protein product [Adineta steineri]CAF1262322.1 unnamed protein product [Adineta steineri]CAF3787904.1 unnamed protein product [Adineta steineri]CAF4016127.1 unnamed protein product [Adineta steineri]